MSSLTDMLCCHVMRVVTLLLRVAEKIVYNPAHEAKVYW